MSESFGDVLNHFKRSEEPENLTPLLEDSMLRNGLVAWKAVQVQYNSERCKAGCDCDDRLERWEWLWSCVNFNLSEFAAISGAKAQDAKTLFIRLKGLMLIYPDGSLNKLARDLLQSIIMAQLQKAVSNPSKKSKG